MKLNDRVNKPNRKKQKTVVEETTSNTRSDSSDETSNEDSTGLKSRTRSTSSSTVPKKDEDKNTRARTRSSSMSSTEMTSMEFKSPKSPAQSEVKTEYTCNKCNKKFDTKLSNAKHRLTHLKQAALKLEKLTVPSVKENQETELESQDEKISEEAMSRSNRTTSVNKRIDDSSEEIAINIEDDTDDEEIFSLSSTENAKKKMAKKKTDEDVVEPNEAKSESRIAKESANKGNIKITKKCEESTVALDETLETEDDKNRQDKDIRDKHTTKDKDETSANRNNDKSEDKDTEKTIAAAMEHYKNVDKERDKDVDVENDTEVSSIEKEKTTSECNNDKDNDDKDNNDKDNNKDDLHEETTRDNEMINSPILSICNTIKDSEDHNENCKTNLENNCKDDQNETIEESEIQCDLMDGSLKEDTKEPEEEAQQILSIDKTLSDKNDFNDIIVINEDKVEELEKLQNKSEENVEIDITDDDKSNSAKDIMSNFLNGEKHDEVKDEDDVTIIPINSDCNDDETRHDEVTEETVPTDDSKKRKLEEELKELEDLVEDNAMNDEYEVQENSTYIPDNSSADAANEILKEVFDLAAAEVQHREESSNIKSLDDVEMETLENISREIRKSADMPSLDPISIMEIDDDNGITLD